jgi:hypothetical protein
LSSLDARVSDSAAAMHLRRSTPQGSEPALDAPYRGFVETFTTSFGLRGWLADPSSELPPELELCIDGECVARTSASVYRPDIIDSPDHSVVSGFAFSPAMLMAAGARTDLSPATELVVRERSTGLILSAQAAWHFADLQALVLAESDVAHEPTMGLPLMAEYKRLASLAYRSMARRLAIDPKRQVGMLEYISPLPGPFFIVAGWMRAFQPTTCGVVLVCDGVKRAGALCCLTQPRADLPGDMRAFVGVLHVDQGLALDRPPSQWAMYFAGQTGEWLTSVQPLRMVDNKDAMAELQRAAETSTDLRALELKRLAQDNLPWTPQATGSEHMGIKVGIDECLVAPGFGVFLTGWVLCPIGAVVNVSAKFGDCVYYLDPLNFCLTERPDLAEVYPALKDRLGQAGVTAVLRGLAAPDPRARWLIRFEFDSGAVHLHEVSLERARVIDTQFDMARLQRAFPGFEAEPWLGELVSSLYGPATVPARAALAWEATQPAAKALVVALPPVRSQLPLALDSFEMQLRHLPPDAGAVLMLPASAPPGLLASWVRSIRLRFPALALSVCRLSASGSAWPALPQVLAHCGIEHFAFVGPEALLTDDGGVAVGQLLAAPAAGLSLLSVEHVAGGEARQAFESMVFVWQAEALRQHLAQAPVLLGDIWRDNQMAGADTARLAGPQGRPMARRLRAPSRGQLVDTINERLCLAHDASAAA